MVKAFIARKQPVPSSLLEGAKVDESNRFYLTAFYDLSTCRSVGMDIGNIPWRDVILYANEKGLSGEFREFFICVIMNLDIKYLEIIRENVKNDDERKKNRNSH